MKLDDLTGKPIPAPNPEQIREAVELTYRGEREAVILVDDQRSEYHFLQMAGDGYLEYRAGKESGMMAASGVDLTLCWEIFVDYARGGTRWKSLTNWVPGQDFQPKGIPGPDSSRGRKQKVGKLLLTAVVGAGAGCLWIYLLTVLPPAEVLIPSAALLAALLNFILIRRKRRLKFDLAPSLPRSGLYLLLWFSLTILGLMMAAATNPGLVSLSTASVLLLGGASIYLAGTRVRDSLRFEREAEMVEADSARLVMVDTGPDAPAHPELAYTYLGKYRGQRNSSGIRFRSKVIRRALAEDRLLVKIRYLPSDPEVHRFVGWETQP